jgi:hypothetical protein
MAVVKAWLAKLAVIPVRLAVFVALALVVMVCVGGLAWHAPRLSFVLLAAVVGIVWLLRDGPGGDNTAWPGE